LAVLKPILVRMPFWTSNGRAAILSLTLKRSKIHLLVLVKLAIGDSRLEVAVSIHPCAGRFHISYCFSKLSMIVFKCVLFICIKSLKYAGLFLYR